MVLCTDKQIKSEKKKIARRYFSVRNGNCCAWGGKQEVGGWFQLLVAVRLALAYIKVQKLICKNTYLCPVV